MIYDHRTTYSDSSSDSSSGVPTRPVGGAPARLAWRAALWVGRSAVAATQRPSQVCAALRHDFLIIGRLIKPRVYYIILYISRICTYI